MAPMLPEPDANFDNRPLISVCPDPVTSSCTKLYNILTKDDESEMIRRSARGKRASATAQIARS